VLQSYVSGGGGPVTLPDTFDRATLGAEYITNSALTDWQIVSSTLRAVAPFDGDWLLWAQPVGADIEVSGSFDVDGTVNQGASNLLARSTSTVYLQDGIAAQLLGGTWTAPQDHLMLRLISIHNNDETVLGTYDLGFLVAPLTTQTITLRCAGDQLSVLYDGAVVIGPVTHSTYQTNTYAGIRIYDGDHAGQHRLREFNAQPYAVVGPTVPSAPAAPVLVAGDAHIVATVTPPANGGSPITGYNWTYRWTGGGEFWSFAGYTTGTTFDFTGITNGQSYDVRVEADNSVGRSAPSSFSSATPAAGTPAIYSDDFNRADGALTTPWVAVGGALAVASNKLTSVGSDLNFYRYNQTFAADQWSEADVAGTVEGGTSIGPAVRINGDDLVYMWFSNIPARVTIWKRIGGAYTQLATNSTAPLAAFRARLEVQGTTYRAYIDGALVATGTDSSLATGQPGVLGANGAGATLDNWRGGDLPYTPLYVGYRTFDATKTQKIVVDVGESTAQTFDTYSLFSLVRATALGSGVSYTHMTAARADGSRCVYWYLNWDSRQETDVINQIYTSGGPQVTVGEWTLLGITKPPGTVQPTYHMYKFGTQAWYHDLGGNLHGTAAMGAGGEWYLGHDRGGEEAWYGDIAAQAFFDRVITTAEVESLDNNLASWLHLNPVHCWRLDQTTITDLVGSAHQKAITGPPAISGESPLLIAPMVFQDSFDRANTTSVEVGGVGLGAEWEGGAWEIASNSAHKTGSLDFAVFKHDVGSPDMWVEADITPNAYGGGAAGGFGCINLRDAGSNADNGYLGFWAPDGRWVIGSVIGGYHDIQSVSSGGIPTFPLHLRLEAQGTALRLYNQDSLVASVTSTERTASAAHQYCGLNAGVEVSVHNYRCGALPYSYGVS
jgi:hypothetical protein